MTTDTKKPSESNKGKSDTDKFKELCAFADGISQDEQLNYYKLFTKYMEWCDSPEGRRIGIMYPLTIDGKPVCYE